MLQRHQQKFGSILIFSDSCGLVASWLLAFYLRFYTQLVPVTKGIPPFSRYVTLTIPVLFIWLVVFSYFKLYRSERIMRRTTELGTVLRAHTVALFLFIVLTFVFTEYRFSRVVIGYFGALSGVYLLFSRLAIRNLLRRLKARGVMQRAVVIIGAGDTALAAVDRFRRMPELGMSVRGFFTKDGAPNPALPFPVLGSYEMAAAHVENSPAIDEVVIALPRNESAAEEAILAGLKDTVKGIHVIPDLYDYIVLGCTVENFDNLPVLALNSSTISGPNVMLKRIFDIVGSALALGLFSPVLVLIAIAVKLTSRGPTFYGQERMGIDGRTFKMWKFRSMRVDAEKETGAVWAKKNDDRRTPIGAFLRATSLDELPQLWNVLVGDMSLVGPRPERPQFVEEFRHNIPGYMLRHKVRAGMTGWAQVNGWRGDTSLEKRIECDLYYIRHWSLFLDLKIMLLTVWRGFVNKNAY
jgi:Undecaprenyl-phosphate glucose phosphotransferase